MRLKELAAVRVRYGYRRLHVLLRREGWPVNAKRVYRLWFDTFEQFNDNQMDDDMMSRHKSECVRTLIDRSRKRGIFQELLDSLCRSRPDIAMP